MNHSAAGRLFENDTLSLKQKKTTCRWPIYSLG